MNRFVRHLPRIALYIGAVVSQCSSPSHAVEIAPQRYAVGEKFPGAVIPYVSSHSLERADPSIRRILFSVHSSGFDAKQYFENARRAAAKVPGAAAQTLIIAPQFFQREAIPGAIPPGMMFWRSSPYRGSARSAIGPEERAISLSAFAVMDGWLTSLVESGSFPGLQEIVMAGHSAGGQFVQRYAMVGKFTPPGEIEIRYVTSAPSSYAYPTAERFNAKTKRFAKPDQRTLAACPSYNQWGYGLESPYVYFSDLDSEAIAKRYAERRVFYLCGSRDNNPHDDTIGKSCGAMMQGYHRLQRMLVFAACMEHKYGKSISRNHVFAVVPGIGHWGEGTMTSRQGLKAIFAPLR